MPYISTRSKHQWQKFWSKSFVTVIAIIQMLLTFAIIGLEIWSAIINLKYSFFFIGFITSVFFTITWISTFTIVCCNCRSRGCVIHLLVEHILSIIASIVLIYFNARFIHSPLTCLWSEFLCKIDSLNITWNNLWFYYNLNTRKIKFIAIKIQLACGVLMLVTSIVFIGSFIHKYIQIQSKTKIHYSRQRIELVRRQYP